MIQTAARTVDGVIDGGPDIRAGAARYPAALTCYIDEFADHGILPTLRYWIEEPYKLLATRSKVQTNVWEVFADADVEIVYPHSHLYFDETSGELDGNVDDSSGASSMMQHDVDQAGTPDIDENAAPDDDPNGSYAVE